MAITPVSPEARDFASALADILRRLEAIEVGLRTGQLGNSSLENSGLNAYDENGNLRYTVGLQDDGTYAGISLNNPEPPPVPSAPVVTPEIAGLKIRYEGETADGIGLPSDWSHAIVEVAPPSGVWTQIGTIISVPGDFIFAPAEYIQYSVRLRNVNHSKKVSEPGAASQGTPTQVVSQDILDGIISETKLAADAVTAAKIKADSIGTGHIQGGAVSLQKLADGSVSAEKIIDGAVSVGKIGAEAVGTNQLAANSIVAGKIATDAIESRHVVAGAIEAGKLAVDSVQAGNIAAEAVTAAKIKALDITSDKLAANAVTAGKIEAGAITAAKLESNLVVASRIIAGNPNGARVELHPTAGLQAYLTNGLTRSVWIDAATGNITAIGTFSSGFSGERAVISPDGSIRFYQATGNAYAEIRNDSTNIRMSGVPNTGDSNRTGYLNMNPSGIGLGYGTPGGTQLAGLTVGQTFVNAKSSFFGIRLDRSRSNPDNLEQRFMMCFTNSSGDIGQTYMHFYYKSAAPESQLHFQNSDVGILGSRSQGNCLYISRYDTGLLAPAFAASFGTPSSVKKKKQVRDLDETDDQVLSIYKLAKAKRYRYKTHGDRVDENDPNSPLIPFKKPPKFKIRRRRPDTPDDAPDDVKWEMVDAPEAPVYEEPEHIFPTAEDLEAVNPSLVTTTPAGDKFIDLRDFIGFQWHTIGILIDRIDDLKAEVAALKRPGTTRS